MLTNLQLAQKFGRKKWDGPIPILTREALARELNVSTRTLRRWEQKGIINKPFNALQGSGRGNHAVYKDPMEGIVSILVRKDDVFIRYVKGRIRWRKRRFDYVETKIVYDYEEDTEEEKE